MRFLKIITFLIVIFCFCMLSYFIYIIISDERNRPAPLYVYTILLLAYVSTIVSLVYHYKSFFFYRREKKQQLHKKLSKLLWIAPLCFSAILIFLFGVTMRDFIRFSQFDAPYRMKDIIFIMSLLFFGTISFLEVVLLKKRIKRLKAELVRKDEIESIGNATL